VFTNNEPKMPICRCNTNKLKNLTNKMCVKTAIKQLNRAIDTIND